MVSPTCSLYTHFITQLKVWLDTVRFGLPRLTSKLILAVFMMRGDIRDRALVILSIVTSVAVAVNPITGTSQKGCIIISDC